MESPYPLILLNYLMAHQAQISIQTLRAMSVTILVVRLAPVLGLGPLLMRMQAIILR